MPRKWWVGLITPAGACRKRKSTVIGAYTTWEDKNPDPSFIAAQMYTNACRLESLNSMFVFSEISPDLSSTPKTTAHTCHESGSWQENKMITHFSLEPGDKRCQTRMGREQGRQHPMEEWVCHLLQEPLCEQKHKEIWWTAASKHWRWEFMLRMWSWNDAQEGKLFAWHATGGYFQQQVKKLVPPSNSLQIHGIKDLITVCAVTRNILHCSE